MKNQSRQRGFMIFDAIAGIGLLVALAAALATAATLRQRNADHLADQRAAIRIAQQAIASGKPPLDAPVDTKIELKYTGKRIGDREWVEAMVIFNGRRATLAGLAPKAGAEQ